MSILKAIKMTQRVQTIRKEAERIDPDADWENAAHVWIGTGLTERQDEAIQQAKINLGYNGKLIRRII